MKRLLALISREVLESEPHELQGCRGVLAAAVSKNPWQAIRTIQRLNFLDVRLDRLL
jgi:hypothetical protein